MTLRFVLILCLSLMGAAQAKAGGLSDAISTYLLSHAGDPVDWHPWTERTLRRARREGKLIFLSIGFSSCHWCHVMRRTTFSDGKVVRALNGNYVNILVDKEERPDLDRYFMKIMSAMIGTSGAPGNFFLTPDLVPITAAGYLAPRPRQGDPGFLDLATSIAREWSENRTGFDKDIAITRSQLQSMWKPPAGGQALDGAKAGETAARAWLAQYDRKYGGFGHQPKFPRVNVLGFLLDRGIRLGDPALLAKIYKSLDQMAAGGMRDQLGGAFHRYAVDRFWQVPHFEILLNENALLAKLYLRAYQASGKARYAAVARAVLDDLVRRLRLPGGGFASSLDSEHEGRDGGYYTWTTREVTRVLGSETAGPFMDAYLDMKHGLVHGRGILRLRGAPETLLGIQKKFQDSRAKLLAARVKRSAQGRDGKVLTSWNALAAGAFAQAARILDDGRYLHTAQEEVANLLAPLAKGGGRLAHSRWNGKPAGEGFLDDYAFLIQALLDLYETDFRIGRLDAARELMKTLISRFQPSLGKSFQLAPPDATSALPGQTVLDEDGLPSGNGAALSSLHRLVLFGAGEGMEKEAEAVIQGLGQYFAENAALAPGLLGALDYRAGGAWEIIIVGKLADPRTRALLRQVYARPLRGTVLALTGPDGSPAAARWPLLAARPMVEGKPSAYVCRKRLCKLPVNSTGDLARQLDRLLTPPPK